MAKKNSTVIDAKKLQHFKAQYSASKSELDERRMSHATLLKQVEDSGFHKAAFKQVMKMLGWDVTKTRDYLRAMEQYSEILGLNAQLADQPELPDQGEAEEDQALAAQ